MKAVAKQGRRLTIPVNSIHQVDKEHDEKWKKEGTKIRPIFFKIFGFNRPKLNRRLDLADGLYEFKISKI